MRRIGTTSGGSHIVEFTESDLACLVKTVAGLQGAVALPAVLSPAPVTDEAETPGDVPRRTEPPRARVAGKAKKVKAAEVASAVARCCIICGRPLPADARRLFVTCGSKVCKAKNQKRCAREWYQKRKDLAAMAAPSPARKPEETPAPVPAADKQARRDLIRRLAEKKGLAGDGEAKGARDLSYVQPED